MPLGDEAAAVSEQERPDVDGALDATTDVDVDRDDDSSPPPPRELTPEEQAAQRDLEAEARSTGWVPEAEWRGERPPASGFKSAEEWVQHPRHLRDLNRRQSEAVEAENRQLRARLERLEQRSTLTTQQQYEADVRAVRARVDTLKAEAFEKGDYRAFRQIEDRERKALTKLKAHYAPERQPTADAPPQPDQQGAVREPTEDEKRVAEDWRSRNQDIDGDPLLRGALLERVRSLAADPAWRNRGVAMLDEAARQIRTRFQTAPASARPAHMPAVETHTRRTMNEPARKTWRDMPQFNRDQYQMARRTSGYKHLSDDEFRKQAAEEYWRERGDD